MDKIINALFYGLSSLVFLWMGAGGDLSAFWARVPLGTFLMLVILGIPLWKFRKDVGLTREHLNSRLVPVFAIVWVAVGYFLFYLSKDTTPMGNPPLMSAIIFCFVLFPLWDLAYRHFLAPGWGIGSVAFLEAITWGFALQNLFPALLMFAFGYSTHPMFPKKPSLLTQMVTKAIALFILLYVVRA